MAEKITFGVKKKGVAKKRNSPKAPKQKPYRRQGR